MFGRLFGENVADFLKRKSLQQYDTAFKLWQNGKLDNKYVERVLGLLRDAHKSINRKHYDEAMLDLFEMNRCIHSNAKVIFLRS